MYLIRCSLSLLLTGVHAPLHFLHATFHKVWYISYLVPISHLPQLLKYFHCILTLFSEISFPFWLWQKPGCPLRTLPAQKPFYFFFSSVLSLLDLEMGGCPPPSSSLSGQVPSLLLVLKLTSSVTDSTIVIYLQQHCSQFIGSLAYCHFLTSFLI